jgi:hypothetical protein
MALMDINWHPDDRHLRRFGLVSLAVGLLFAAVALVRHGGSGTAPRAFESMRLWAPLALGGLAAVMGLLRPRWLKPFYLGLTALTWPLGWCVSYVVLAAIFVGLFVPVAIAFRLLGRDALQRRFNRTSRTYWIRRPVSTPASYLRQS